MSALTSDARRRPFGVVLLMVLHFFGGLLLMGTLVQHFGELDSIQVIGFPPALAVAAIVLISGTALASSIGMFLATRWGWWCATFYYVYGVARHSNGALMALQVADKLEEPSFYLARAVGRVLVHLLLLLYFFKPNVLEYFGTSDVSKGKAIGVLIAVTLAIAVLSAVIVTLAG